MLAQWDQPVAYCPAHPPVLVNSLATLSPLIFFITLFTLLVDLCLLPSPKPYFLVTSQTLNLMLFYDKFHTLISHFLGSKKKSISNLPPYPHPPLF